MATATNGTDNKKGYKVTALQLSLEVLREYAADSIPKEDIEDFAKLVTLLLTGEEDEREAALEGMVEIINQEPVEVTQFDFKKKPGKEIKSWKEFVSKKIKEQRELAKMTQGELAKKSGLQQSHISRLEKGVFSPTNETLKKIAKALKIEIQVLDPSAEE